VGLRRLLFSNLFILRSLRRLTFLSALFFLLYPSSINRIGFPTFSGLSVNSDPASGEIVVPLEEIYPAQPQEADFDVVKYALRIMEQHYVQRERLVPLNMLKSAIKSLRREFGNDIQIGLTDEGASAGRLLLSGHRTVRLCPSSAQESATLCQHSEDESADVPAGVQVVLRVGLRVFGVLMSSDPGLKSLDLIGRYIIPEYAKLKGVSSSKAVHVYLNGLLDELDPHSSYMTREEYRELRSGTRGQFGGVGLVIDESQELPVIREVVPNSPAHMAGIRPGDIMLKVGKKLSAFRSLENVLRDIREIAVEKASPVWFFRPSSKRVYRSYLAREEIPTRSAEMRVVEGHPEILHIRVTGFSNHTADDVQSLYDHGQRAARGRLKLMLLDLRGNPGGLLDQAIQVSDLFIRQGKIVSTRSRFEEQVEQATRSAKIDLPLVVLVNSSSASASEIVAGALKDHGRALVVGERTFGKGSVQSLFELATGTALKLTVAHYFTPAGQSLQGIGIEPHVAVKLVQPKEDHLWMSGSSELDREEHLVSHLHNPSKLKSHKQSAHKLMLNMWALSKAEEQVLEGLRPLSFAYPLGDNTKSSTVLDEDALARVGVKMGLNAFGGRPMAGALTEKQLRDAYRKVSYDEAQALKAAVDQLATEGKGDWKTLAKSFFETGPDEKGLDSSAAQAAGPRAAFSGSQAAENQKKSRSGRFVRDFADFFGIWSGTKDKGSVWPLSAPRLSLSAKSLMAWQGPAQVLMSIDPAEVKLPARTVSATALLGLRLDDFHDGPVVWIPAHFSRLGDKSWVASVRIPQAVRSYLSMLATAGEKPVVIGQLKWKLGDVPLALGPMQIPQLARRRGHLTGYLSQRSGHNILHFHFSVYPDVAGRGGRALPALSALSEGDFGGSGLEVLVATLTDKRLGIPTEVIPLQRIAQGEYRGETEIILSEVEHQGLGFGGIVGGIVRSTAGDVVQSAPLLLVGDDGVRAIEESDFGRLGEAIEF
jgi:carboxyl-terminal processing protease